jgi:hypothetical protein
MHRFFARDRPRALTRPARKLATVNYSRLQLFAQYLLHHVDNNITRGPPGKGITDD